MVLNRLEGTPLSRCIEGLSHSDRRRVAKKLGAIFREMLSVHSRVSGKLMLRGRDKSLQTHLHVAPWYENDSEDYPPFCTATSSTDAGKILVSGLSAWKSEEHRLRPGTLYKPHLIGRLITVAEQLDETGCLNDIPVTLGHFDFDPRNVMVRFDAKGPTQKLAVSGILDWDSAALVPAFMSCVPPSWVWADWSAVDGEESDEDSGEDSGEDVVSGGYYQPSTPEGVELKRLFDEAAGTVYRRFAYEPNYHFAKRLMRFIMEGMKSNEATRERRKLCFSRGSRRHIAQLKPTSS